MTSDTINFIPSLPKLGQRYVTQAIVSKFILIEAGNGIEKQGVQRIIEVRILQLWAHCCFFLC